MSDKNWRPPAITVEPVNHFHTIYMRLGTMNDALMQEVGDREEILKNPLFVELIANIAQFFNLSARMTVCLEIIRREFPELWEMWQRASEHEPTEHEAGTSVCLLPPAEGT